MDLTQLINHPEQLNRETLYELRSLLAQHPYYQSARLLMLQNLYLLHDASFDAELRKAAVYFSDRKVLFNLVEAAHYKFGKEPKSVPSESGEENRTITLINDFLESIPKEEVEEKAAETGKKRKPTPADAAIDYVSYLLDVEKEEEIEPEKEPQMKGQSLIDNFIQNENGKIRLKEEIDYTPDIDHSSENDENDTEEGIFTETLAKIYIKQGRFDKALEIIQRLNLLYPKKNAYFADQIRFLEKLIINNKQN
ncbi:MAG: tetratricopeptide repeat protein [Prevotella sp.]|nr:tetratricopeptide repeat protein [Prevotella sp.]MBR6495044.1 tetratricopeptide repeat protein [Prevotella sp.]